VPLRSANARPLAANLQPFVATGQAKVLADEESNKLILLVPQPLLGSLLKLIEELDVPFEKDRVRVVALHYLDAAAIGPRLEKFLASAQRGTGGYAGGDPLHRVPGAGLRAAPPEQPAPAAQASDLPAGARSVTNNPGVPAAAPGPAGAQPDAARAGSQWLVQFMVEPT
jgi:hypothetical protein